MRFKCRGCGIVKEAEEFIKEDILCKKCVEDGIKPESIVSKNEVPTKTVINPDLIS